MEQWEAIRNLARKKRQELLQDVYSDSAAALIAAAENQTTIRCRPVPSGDSLLSGADAVLDPEAMTIWYDSGLQEEFAVLCKAHEFAHSWIDGTRATCSATDVESDPFEEHIPTGVEHVESYGPKERRELQANVFAREFLLPVDRLRSWFVKGKLSASDIATKVGVPPHVVFQQLAYALLTPDSPNPASESLSTQIATRSRNLDTSQAKAARLIGVPVLVRAGPGTGKTSTLVHRVIHLVRDRHVDPASILVLTFSNKAAAELRERVVREMPAESPHIWMGTFHSFGLEVLRKYGAYLGLPASPDLLDPVAAQLLLEQSMGSLSLSHYLNLYEPSLALREILAAISRAKDELVDPTQYSALAMKMRDNAASAEEIIAAEKALEVASVYEFYQRRLDAELKLDFGDLIFKPILLFRQNVAAKERARQDYRYILVDEYQDVNRACALLLKELAGDGENLWAVGDERQSIYRFRGAAPRNLREFPKDFPGAEIVHLNTNYRSQPGIISAFSAMAPKMQTSLGDEFTPWKNSRRDEGGRVLMKIAEDRESEAMGIAHEINRLVQEGIPFHQQAVICRTHTTLGRLAVILEGEGIPVFYLGDLFERSEIRDFLSLLSLASGDGLGLVRVAKFSEYQIPLDDVFTVLRHSEEQEVPFPRAIGHFARQTDISEKGKNGLELLERHLEDICYGTTPWSFLMNYLFVRSQYLWPFIADLSLKAQQCKLAIFQFLSFANEQNQAPQSDEDPKKGFLNYVRRLEIFGEEKQLRQLPECAKNVDAVKLLTVHASKGLEFRAVYLPGLGQGYFPIRRQAEKCPPPTGMIPDSGQDEHDEEEECLFFVALSRARDHLCLSRAQKYGALNSSHSQLLSLIANALPEPIDNPPVWKKASDEIVSLDTPRNPISSRSYGAEALDLYIRCPLRYYWQEVSGLDAKSESSAYVRFHRSLRKLLRWLEGEKADNVQIDGPRLVSQIEGVWGEIGPVGFPFEETYKKVATAILFKALDGEFPKNDLTDGEKFDVELTSGIVTLIPDQLEQSSQGVKTLRRTRVGKISASEKTKDIYALYQYVSEKQSGSKPKVEIFSFSTGEFETVTLTPKTAKTRLERYDGAIRGIQDGQFAPKPADRECPRCPYYFICLSGDNDEN